MDDSHFDRIAAHIGTTTTRRSALAALLGGALSATFAQSPQHASAQGEGDSCRNDEDCGRGLFCKRSSRNRRGKHDRDGRRRSNTRDGRHNRDGRSECRYIDGCGEQGDFCEVSDDCCGSLRCNQNRERCE